MLEPQPTTSPQSPAKEAVRLCANCQRPLSKDEKPGHFEDKIYHRACLDQILAVKARRSFHRTFFLPYLEDNTKSIEEAKIFLQSLSVAINQEFNNRKRTMKVDSLKLLDRLDPKAKGYEKYKKMIKVLNHETIFEALTSIDDMQNAIAAKIQEEEKGRTLANLGLQILE